MGNPGFLQSLYYLEYCLFRVQFCIMFMQELSPLGLCFFCSCKYCISSLIMVCARFYPLMSTGHNCAGLSPAGAEGAVRSKENGKKRRYALMFSKLYFISIQVYMSLPKVLPRRSIPGDSPVTELQRTLFFACNTNWAHLAKM